MPTQATLAEIKAAAKAKIAALLPNAKVYRHLRNVRGASDEVDAVIQNTSTKAVDYWVVSRERTVGVDKGPQRSEDRVTLIIRGHRSVQDGDDGSSSEEQFDTDIESIRAAFRSDRSLGGIVFDSDVMEASTVGYAMFANVLVHYCELRIVVHTYPLAN